LSYNERLSVLGLERLELRRIRADLIMCYKIVNGLVHSFIHSFIYLLRITSANKTVCNAM